MIKFDHFKMLYMMNHMLSIAPMMDYTDRHCRYFHRTLSKHVLLYTEMITTGALIHGDRERFLQYDPAEHPIAIQLGGSDPAALAQCAQMAEDAGYDEINLNVGCPSDRVQSGQFGLILMKQPALVAQCIQAMKKVVSIPVTIKTRTGVDDRDDIAFLRDFITQQIDAGVDHISIHARKGWLNGLSPKENRDVPPLDYERVYQMKREFPTCSIGINGGIQTLDEIDRHLQHVDTAMIGRHAYQHPYWLTEVDQRFFDSTAAVITPQQVIEAMCPYVEKQLSDGIKLNRITRHMLGLFQGKPGAKQWRRYLSENAHLADANLQTLLSAAALTNPR